MYRMFIKEQGLEGKVEARLGLGLVTLVQYFLMFLLVFLIYFTYHMIISEMSS